MASLGRRVGHAVHGGHAAATEQRIDLVARADLRRMSAHRPIELRNHDESSPGQKAHNLNDTVSPTLPRLFPGGCPSTEPTFPRSTSHMQGRRIAPYREGRSTPKGAKHRIATHLRGFPMGEVQRATKPFSAQDMATPIERRGDDELSPSPWWFRSR